MMTFFGFAWVGAVEGGAAGSVPSGTRLSLLALELPSSITPTIAGLTVGAFVGVVGFIAVMLLVGRGQRRPVRRPARAAADQVVFIPPYTPYGAPQRPTLMPPQAFATHTPAPGAAAVTVARVVVLSSPAPSSSLPLVRKDESAPHPLGIIKSTSAAMRAAPIADLAFDDGPTEIGETYFDECPQPRRRSDPPKIRAVRPAAPRFPGSTPLLPQVTPPPALLAPGSRSPSSRG